MSQNNEINDMKKFLLLVSLALGVMTGISGLFGAWFVIPTKMEMTNQRVGAVEQKQDRDHDLLLRIEERLINVQKQQTTH